VKHSTPKAPPSKPAKPRADFPLFPHRNGLWAKKIKGRFRYYGSWRDDPNGEAALEDWLKKKDFHLSGREAPVEGDEEPAGVTVTDLADEYLIFKERALLSGDIAQRTFDVCETSARRLVAFFGKHQLVSDLRPADFGRLRANLAKGRGPVWLKNEVSRMKAVFRYGEKAGTIEPVNYGLDFERPSAKVLRAARQQRGPRMFKPEEVRAALGVATVNAKAMMLLALNCGLGNTDLGLLPIKAIGLDKAILDFPRSKTATERVVPLWPETVKAVRETLEHRPEPKDEADKWLLFIRPRSRDNYVGDHTGTRVHGLIRRTLEKAKIKGRTAYDFRRTFQTIGESARDLPAVQAIMGHAAAQNDMSAVYRQGVDIERKRAVVNCVRRWLFPRTKKK